MSLTIFDHDALNKIKMSIGGLPSPVDGFPHLPTYDIYVDDQMKMSEEERNITESRVIPWQFPPKIISTSKKGNWQEQDFASYEPFAIFKGAQARSLSVEGTFIVTDSVSGVTNSNNRGIVYDAVNIGRIVRTVMAYFYRSLEQSINPVPVIEIAKLYEHQGRSNTPHTTWRMMSCDVSFGDTLIRSNHAFRGVEQVVDTQIKAEQPFLDPNGLSIIERTFTDGFDNIHNLKTVLKMELAQINNIDRNSKVRVSQTDNQGNSETVELSGSQSFRGNIPSKPSRLWY